MRGSLQAWWRAGPGLGSGVERNGCGGAEGGSQRRRVDGAVHRRGCLKFLSLRLMDRRTALEYANQSDTTLCSSRFLTRAEETGRVRFTSRMKEAANRKSTGDRTGLRANPRSPARSDRDHVASLPKEGVVLELLRPRHRAPLELRRVRFQRGRTHRGGVNCGLLESQCDL